MEPRVRVMHKGKHLGCKPKSHQRLPPRRQPEQLVPPRSPGSICAAGPACSRGGAAPGVSRRGGLRDRGAGRAAWASATMRPGSSRHRCRARPGRDTKASPSGPATAHPPTLGSRAGLPQRLGDRLPNVAAEQAEQQRSGPAHLRAAGAAGRSGSPRSVTGGRAPRLPPWRCGSARRASRPIGRGPATGRSLLRAPRRASPERRGRSAGALTPSCPAPRPPESLGPQARGATWRPPHCGSPGRPRPPCLGGPVAAVPCSCSSRLEAFEVTLGYLRAQGKHLSLGCDLSSCSCPSHYPLTSPRLDLTARL